MSNLLSTSGKVQIKFHQFTSRYANELKKPIVKFIRNFCFGSICSKTLKTNPISKSLQEHVTTKKTAERMSYHLSKGTMFSDITQAHLHLSSPELENYKYLIFDDSDIAKPQAKCMEGLGRVRDGSRSSKKNYMTNGYKWSNIIAANNRQLLPLYSEIYSITLDKDYQQSENTKMLNIVDTVRKHTGKNKIVVIDRGGDREVLMREFMDREQYFLIRQTGRRHLWFNDKAQPLKKVYQEITLNQTVIVTRNNKKPPKKFRCGAMRVQLPKKNFNEQPYPKQLWLVTTKEENKGFCWFLLYSEAKTAEEAVNEVTEGYRLRWRIEEFHRQVKQDFDLEEITSRKYSTIKSIGAMLTIIMSFIANGCEYLNECLLTITRQNQKNNEKMPSYIWYRMTDAISKLFSIVVRYKPKKKYVNDDQLLLFELL